MTIRKILEQLCEATCVMEEYGDGLIDRALSAIRAEMPRKITIEDTLASSDGITDLDQMNGFNAAIDKVMEGLK